MKEMWHGTGYKFRAGSTVIEYFFAFKKTIRPLLQSIFNVKNIFSRKNVLGLCTLNDTMGMKTNPQ